MSKYTQEYLDYLSSDKWKQKRIKIAEQRNYTCELCNKVCNNIFHIHHLTYEHLGYEEDDELMFLCEECHKNIHDKCISLSRVLARRNKNKRIKNKNELNIKTQSETKLYMKRLKQLNKELMKSKSDKVKFKALQDELAEVKKHIKFKK